MPDRFIIDPLQQMPGLSTYDLCINQERHLVTREIYKRRRSAALAKWRTVMA